MNQEKTIKWGIIGLGKIAHKFAQDLATVENAELYAVASRTKAKAESFAKQFAASRAYGAYEELAKDSIVDAVYIATPHVFHKENTLVCLKNQKAVLCEKPLAMSFAEVEEMIECAKKNNVLLMEGLWTYFLPHYQQVLDLIKNGTYGKILKLEADFGFEPKIDMTSRVFDKSLGGGSLLDIGIYPIFAALSTLGEPIDIDAKATFFENGVDSSSEMIFNYDGAVKAFLKSTLLENTATEAIFHCESAIVKINSRFHEPSTLTIYQNGNENTLEFPCDTLGYNFEIDHFNTLLQKNEKESDIMSFRMSKQLISTIDKVRAIVNLSYKKTR